MVDTHAHWNKFYNLMSKEHSHDPREIPYEGEVPHWGYHESICKTCYNHCLHSSELMRAYPLVEGAEEILYWLRTLGADIHLITARPPGTDPATQAWAQEKLGYLLSSVTSTTNKIEVASVRRCKYHLEDSPLQLRAFFTQKEITPIIWSKPYNLNFDGFRVYSWSEFATLIMFKEHR